MAQKAVSPLTDYAFSLLFGDQRNIEVLEGFLKTILDIPPEEYDSLTIMSPFLKRLFGRDKLGIVDVRVTTKSGRILHIELQVEKHAYMKHRTLYYISKLLWEQMKRGFEYESLHQVISIVICNHRLVEESSYVNTYELRNKRSGKQFTDLIKVIILELPKVPEERDGQAVWPWLKFLKGRTAEEQEALAKIYPEVGMAVRAINRISGSEVRRLIREAEGLRQTDLRMLKLAAWEDGRGEGLAAGREEGHEEGLAAGREEGRAEGHEEGLAAGREEGREEGRRETAKKLKVLGFSVEQIAAATGLDPEEIEKL
jgi:predicted transposase/invertase (TIGR01784 family)